LICRGDLAFRANTLFMDVEKVTLEGTHLQVAGDVAVVDEMGRIIFWAYIQRSQVCMYNTSMTGLSAEKLKMGLDITMVRKFRFSSRW